MAHQRANEQASELALGLDMLRDQKVSFNTANFVPYESLSYDIFEVKSIICYHAGSAYLGKAGWLWGLTQTSASIIIAGPYIERGRFDNMV